MANIINSFMILFLLYGNIVYLYFNIIAIAFSLFIFSLGLLDNLKLNYKIKRKIPIIFLSL
ncbi:hypothetical protein X966_03965 [Borrelia parkeri HR1]|nr:hypothetical protein X966_03965 [Borrelia parkeri HR1]